MKNVSLYSILCLCFAIAPPALGELTPQDLDKIRLIVSQEIESEIEPIKADIVSLKTDVAWLRGKLEGVDKQFESVNKQFEGIDKQFGGVDKQFESVNRQITHNTYLIYGLIGLVAAAIGIPQIIMAWRSAKDRVLERQDRVLERQIETLREEIETLKKQRIVGS